MPVNPDGETTFPLRPPTTLPVAGRRERFPVHWIYCVGRNYAAHIREMGRDPSREAPFFFMKPADTLLESGAPVSYPPRTANFQHEIELVVAIGTAGRDVAVDRALEHVYGYAVGNDLTRRDLQLQARDAGRPWFTGKVFDRCATLSAIHRYEDVGHLNAGRIWLSVNGTVRQESDLRKLIWSVPEIIAELSTYFTLVPGDLIYTGTPEGVGPLVRGDRVEGGIDGLDTLSNTIV